MGVGKKLVVLAGIITVLVIEGLWLLVGFLVQSIWLSVIASVVIFFTIYYFYARLCQERQTQYPLAPLEGKTDTYLPRTDIPRPVHADFRRMQEEKKKFERIEKRMKRKRK